MINNLYMYEVHTNQLKTLRHNKKNEQSQYIENIEEEILITNKMRYQIYANEKLTCQK